MPLISVIVPVWNTSRYLSQCLDSLLLQTFENIEIIVVNDGTSDDSQNIIDRYKKQDSRIKCIVHPQRLGLMLARQSGFDVSQGQYIANVDSDDFVEPKMLQVMLAAAVSANADIVQCGGKIVENGAVSRFDYFHPHCSHLSGDDIFLNFLRRKIPYSLCNKLYTRDVWKRARVHLPDFNVKTEDVLFNAALTLYAREYVALEDQFYNYRVRPDSGFHDTSVDMVCYRAWSACHNIRVIEDMVAAERKDSFASEALADFKRHYLLIHLGNFTGLKNVDIELGSQTLEKCLGYIDRDDFVRYGAATHSKRGRLGLVAAQVIMRAVMSVVGRIGLRKEYKDQ